MAASEIQDRAERIEGQSIYQAQRIHGFAVS